MPHDDAEAGRPSTSSAWRIGGVMGGIVAGSLFILPGAVLVTALAWLHAAGGRLTTARATLGAVRRPASAPDGWQSG